MQVEHPNAGDGPGTAPAAVDVRGETVPVEDGVFEIADGQQAWLDAFAGRHGVDPDTIVREEDGPPDDDGVTVDEVEAIADEVIADRIDDGECPWCNDYDGENVAQHASAAHPDYWAGYRED